MLTSSVDLSDFRARRRQTTEELLGAMPRIVRKAATEGRDHAKAVGQFQDRSGDLRKSIVAVMGPSITRGATADIQTDVPYAKPIEEGARPHVIKARRARFLRFVVDGRVVFTKKVSHPGNKPYPFMGPAYIKAEAVGVREAEVAAARVPRIWR